eukprot:TRINITY_DN31926_c0_g2_i1.p1 TRINITY_DN31926_c0_g2~~TRINITY_DN31926_c0_g2_i1.p1  ORF type:complete len:189 (-),score=9.91 TRINITY_DN31926_c0_g2_i1:101-610(-)
MCIRDRSIRGERYILYATYEEVGILFYRESSQHLIPLSKVFVERSDVGGRALFYMPFSANMLWVFAFKKPILHHFVYDIEKQRLHRVQSISHGAFSFDAYMRESQMIVSNSSERTLELTGNDYGNRITWISMEISHQQNAIATLHLCIQFPLSFKYMSSDQFLQSLTLV